MNVLVLGAAGKTGRMVVEELLRAKHLPTAFVRHPERYTAPAGVKVVTGDASNAGDVTAAVKGCDAVISALGHTSASKSTALTDAARTLVTALPAGTRFIGLTGNGVADAADPPRPLGGNLITIVIKLLPGGVYEDGFEQVAIMRASALDWTMIRAPRLSEKKGTGAYDLGYFRSGLLDSISHADVALAMVQCLSSNEWARRAPMIRRKPAVPLP